MYRYGAKSSDRLSTCHPALDRVFRLALEISPYDITIIHGYRGQELQDSLFDAGLSKLAFPKSKHNATDRFGQPCSEAVDFAPWVNGGIDWNDTLIFSVVAGVLFAAASEHDIELRWGGDWDGDGSSRDQSFMDLGHIEIIL